MKSLLLFPLFFVPLIHAGPRVWTSTDGKQLEAEFVQADASGVTVRKAGGEKVVLPYNLLSEGDKAAAAKLAKEQAERRDRDRWLKGPLTYGLSKGHESWPEDRKKRITEAMDAAVAFYNQHGNFKKHVTANNSPGTPTADANWDGWINWGGSINRRVALHEISHTLGIGTHQAWHANIKDGKWTGKHALAQLREFDGPSAVLHADRMHFWPYGLNFDNESSPENDIRHVKMVAALRKDMGIE